MKKLSIFSVMALAIIFISLSAFGVFKKTENAKTSILTNIKGKKHLSDKGKALLRKEVLAPIGEIYDIDIDGKMYSRCPTGLDYHLVDNPAKNGQYFIGWTMYHHGCEGKRVCKFRINPDESNVEVLDKKKGKFVAARKWVEARQNNKSKKQKEASAEI